ncbi:hypothetical protein TSMEX_005709 [Taenia solium]|eukprot:TsM_000188700 transcript=TsM_000188700 gene=TsM_000188700
MYTAPEDGFSTSSSTIAEAVLQIQIHSWRIKKHRWWGLQCVPERAETAKCKNIASTAAIRAISVVEEVEVAEMEWSLNRAWAIDTELETMLATATERASSSPAALEQSIGNLHFCNVPTTLKVVLGGKAKVEEFCVEKVQRAVHPTPPSMRTN